MSNIVNGFNFDQLPVKIEYVGKVDDKKWPHFLWNVTVNYKTGFWTFPYKCGLGHVEKKPGAMPMPNPPYRKGTLAYEQWERANMQPKKPSVADIMYSILLDIQAADQSFTNWCDEYGYDNGSMKAFKTYQTCCDEYGYDNGSMKAFKTYQTCCEYAVFVKKAFTADQVDAMRTALEDY